MLRRQSFASVGLILAFVFPVGASQAENARSGLAAPCIQICADLSEASRGVLHAEVELPVQPGPATFTTPLWLPASHAPNGPIGDICGIVFTAGGQTLPWQRDELVLSRFHVVVPPGVFSLHAHLDAVNPGRTTRAIAMLEWESLLLYPTDVSVRELPIQAAVTVPAGWDIGTSLVRAGTVPNPRNTGIDQEFHQPPPDAATIRFAPTSVEVLQDSPVLAGRYFHEYPLVAEAGVPAHFLDLAGDKPDDAKLRPEVIAALGRLVRETWAAYGSHHYDVYRFLVTRSDYAGGDGGTEHAQSTDIGMGTKTFLANDTQMAEAGLMVHEFIHSWNGKYRRPTGLCTPDFAAPMRGRLLWVYEGMTQYWENVLAARAGLKSVESYREMLALTAADADARTGRAWRSTEDTAVAVGILHGFGAPWVNWRRYKDYYADGELLWLDVDTRLRELSGDTRSLDDFTRIFLGKGGNTGPGVLPYDLEEIVADLNTVAPFDWKNFLEERVARTHPRADLDGIVRGGYRLVFADHPSHSESVFSEPDSALYGGQDFWYSLGLRVKERGALADVRWGSPADRAGLAPRQTILTVNGGAYSGEVLRAAVAKAKTDPEPIRLTVRQEEIIFPAAIDYHDGERYPVLERVDGTRDRLEAITQARTSP